MCKTGVSNQFDEAHFIKMSILTPQASGSNWHFQCFFCVCVCSLFLCFSCYFFGHAVHTLPKHEHEHGHPMVDVCLHKWSKWTPSTSFEISFFFVRDESSQNNVKTYAVTKLFKMKVGNKEEKGIKKTMCI